jgi:hypothetical protein
VNRLVAAANYGWPDGTGPLEDQRFTDPVVYFPETIVPTGCAVWRGALYVGSYGDGLVRRFSLDPPAGERSRVASFDDPVLDLAVGPDDRLYVATATGIWRLGAPPASAEPDEGAVRATASPGGDAPASGDDGTPGWILAAIGVVLAVALAATLRLASRRG